MSWVRDWSYSWICRLEEVISQKVISLRESEAKLSRNQNKIVRGYMM